VIDAILEDDKNRPTKQRHTAKRIFDRLREEHGYPGGYTVVKDYVHRQKVRKQEMFVPLRHAPGEAQADFGEAWVVIAGVEQKAHYFAMDLPHSDDCFVGAYPAESTEAFLDGHVRAFDYFGGVPGWILYDNTKLAVAKILGDGQRKKTQAFCELQSVSGSLRMPRSSRMSRGTVIKNSMCSLRVPSARHRSRKPSIDVSHGNVLTAPALSLLALIASTFTGSGFFLSGTGLPRWRSSACSNCLISVRKFSSPASKTLRSSALAVIAC